MPPTTTLLTLPPTTNPNAHTHTPTTEPTSTGLSLCHNGPPSPVLPAAVPAWPELEDESIGFRGRDAVELAAAFLPSVPPPPRVVQQYPQPLGAVTDGGPVDRVLIVGPGMVRIRVHDPRTKDPAPPLDLEDDMLDGRPQPTLLDFLNEADDDQDDDDAAEMAGIVRTFSRASRRRLGRAIACLDWTEAIHPGWRLALFTATYPDDWRAACPDPDTAYRHLRALAKRFKRATGLKLKGVWKREFQRRGAPHFHVLTPLPAMIGSEPVREWFARSWYEIVASGDERHRRAGTAVDWSEGLRMQDANRAAAYFTGYSAGKATGKAYQDVAPEDWANENGSVGRWWGVIGMTATTAEARVTADDLVRTKRLLRGVLNGQKRMRKVTVRRVDLTTGEISYRRVTRRYRLTSLNGGARSGFTFLTNDGPALTIAIARALDTERRPWTPGERRPLP